MKPDVLTKTGKCLNCGADFKKRRSDQKYCSASCRIENWHFKTGGKKAIGDILKRLDHIEKHLGFTPPDPFDGTDENKDY
jgi:hypothetical protein